MTEPSQPTDPLSAPVAATVPHRREHHGDVVDDPYEWLRDKESPDTLALLEAENAYAEARTSHLGDLRERLFDEIRQRTQETDLSVPSRRGAYWYYTRTVEGEQYARHCRCPVADPDDWTPPVLEAGATIADEEVLLDGNVEAEGHEFFSLGALALSHDATRLAFSVDTTGDERFRLRIRDLASGDLLADTIDEVSYGATWSLDGRYVFYTTVDDAWRPDRVWRHEVGTPSSDDVVVLHEPDDRYWVGVGSTRSDRYLVISVGSKITTELHVIDAADPASEPRVVLPRREGVEYSVEHAVVGGSDRFLILHNDGADNFELVEAPADDPRPERWTVLVPHRDDVRLEDVDAFADHLVVSYRRDAMTRLGVVPLAADGYGELDEVDFDHELYSVGLASNPEWNQPLVRLVLTSFVLPGTVYDLDLVSGELVQRKQQQVLPLDGREFDPDEYVQHRLWATADDGEQIPISLVHRRDALESSADGTLPTLLYGYGSYEASMDPTFGLSRLSLLDRGVAFALAHVRGGGERGRRWYDQGKQLTKRNTFTDFVACGRHLVAEGWTTHDRMVAEGGSAGGLLMGAVANLAPADYAGILAVVPFVDPLTSILDPSLPLTVIEWDEWGDPLHDPEVYAYMKGYSPYENVAAQPYPPILAVTSLNDTRVLYVEPAKWVSRLRATATGRVDVLLKTEMSAGHGGVSGRYASWRERAWELAWVLDRLGRATT